MITTLYVVVFKLKFKKRPISIRKHKTLSGAECYRLIDGDGHAILNTNARVVKSLIRNKTITSTPAPIIRNNTLF